MVLNTTKYNLPYPQPEDVADVPQHIKDLTGRIEVALDTKTTPADVAAVYQRKVMVLTALPATGNEGDIVFLIN